MRISNNEYYLVVVGEGNDGPANAENHGRVNLAVRMRAAISARILAAQIAHTHCYHTRFLLVRVQIFDHTSCHQF